MKICRTINEISHLQSLWKQNQQTLALVPTMGSLHHGHLELCRLAKQRGDRVVVSIFVNPLQFGPNEDLQNYPRNEALDLEKLLPFEVDAVFIPSVEEMLPENQTLATQIIVNAELSNDLCGKTRPGHFFGVTTIVAKLFHIVQPQMAIFGEKDYQQLTLIRQMIKDLNMPITICSLATVREDDGLALSSRNLYLTAEDRKLAPLLYASLMKIKAAVLTANHTLDHVLENARDQLNAANFRVDYLEIRCADTLKKPTSTTSSLVVLGAAYLGRTRLIDNLLIN